MPKSENIHHRPTHIKRNIKGSPSCKRKISYSSMDQHIGGMENTRNGNQKGKYIKNFLLLKSPENNHWKIR